MYVINNKQINCNEKLFVIYPLVIMYHIKICQSMIIISRTSVEITTKFY